jgi:hypothetical protein
MSVRQRKRERGRIYCWGGGRGLYRLFKHAKARSKQNLITQEPGIDIHERSKREADLKREKINSILFFDMIRTAQKRKIIWGIYTQTAR